MNKDEGIYRLLMLQFNRGAQKKQKPGFCLINLKAVKIIFLQAC